VKSTCFGYTQGMLELSIVRHKPKEVPVADPHVTAEEKPRLSRQSAQILAALRSGPKSNSELMAIAQRFGARLFDLRQAGYTVDVVSRDRETGRVVYALAGEPACPTKS
jgi:hypothetical protein